MLPEVVWAMLPTKPGSWNSTDPALGASRNVSVTAVPCVEMVAPVRWPSVVGKLVTDMTLLEVTQLWGTSRSGTTNVPAFPRPRSW